MATEPLKERKTATMVTCLK